MKTKVYRIETTRGGVGIYNVNAEGLSNSDDIFAVMHMREAHKHNEMFPDFREDFSPATALAIGLDDTLAKFGCPSFDEFVKWFDGYIDIFANSNDISIMEFEVENPMISFSGKQCLFDAATIGRRINHEIALS